MLFDLINGLVDLILSTCSRIFKIFDDFFIGYGILIISFAKKLSYLVIPTW